MTSPRAEGSSVRAAGASGASGGRTATRAATPAQAGGAARAPSPALVAGAWTAPCAVLVYAAIRAVQKLLLREANPATVIWSAHSGFFWRCLTVAYVSGAIFAVAYLAARRSPEGATRWLPTAISVAAALLALQAALAP